MLRNWRQISLTASLSPFTFGALAGQLSCGAKFRLRSGRREICLLAGSADRPGWCPMDCARLYVSFSAALRVICHD